MRLQGFCTGCGKFKWVMVKMQDVVRSYGGTMDGICQECEDK